MTRQTLKQANELQRAIDTLQSQQEELKEMQELCWEDADISKKALHNYFIRASDLDGRCTNSIVISAIGAYQAVSRDVKDIENEIEKLSKEFDELL